VVLFYLALQYEQGHDYARARKAYFGLIQERPASKYVPYAYLAFGKLFFDEAVQGDASKWPLARDAYGATPADQRGGVPSDATSARQVPPVRAHASTVRRKRGLEITLTEPRGGASRPQPHRDDRHADEGAEGPA
jgi:hypothetical protein